MYVIKWFIHVGLTASITLSWMTSNIKTTPKIATEALAFDMHKGSLLARLIGYKQPLHDM